LPEREESSLLKNRARTGCPSAKMYGVDLKSAGEAGNVIICLRPT
jgi:hypothetical protein